MKKVHTFNNSKPAFITVTVMGRHGSRTCRVLNNSQARVIASYLTARGLRVYVDYHFNEFVSTVTFYAGVDVKSLGYVDTTTNAGRRIQFPSLNNLYSSALRVFTGIRVKAVVRLTVP